MAKICVGLLSVTPGGKVMDYLGVFKAADIIENSSIVWPDTKTFLPQSVVNNIYLSIERFLF